VGVRVPHAVRHRLDGDAEGGDLGRRAQRGQCVGGLHPDVQTGAAERQALGLLPEGPDQTQLVEGRRPEAVDQPTHVVHGGGRLALELAEQGAGGRWIVLQPGGDQVQAEGDPGKRGADPVVQVPAQATAFLLARLDQPGPRRAQRIGECGCGDGGARRPGELGEQLEIAGVEGATVPPFEQQSADPLSLVVQRQLVLRSTVRLPGSGLLTGRRLHPDVRKAQGSRDRLRERGQRRAGCSGGLEAGGEAGERGVRVAPVPVHRPVDDLLEPRTQRQHQGADDPDRYGPGPRVHGQRPAERPDQRRVQRDDRAGQAGVDQRPVQDDVDLVEPVPDDRQPDRRGHQREDDEAGDGEPGRGVVARGGDHDEAEHGRQQQEEELAPFEPTRDRPPPTHGQRRHPGREADEQKGESEGADTAQDRRGALDTHRVVRRRVVEEGTGHQRAGKGQAEDGGARQGTQPSPPRRGEPRVGIQQQAQGEERGEAERPDPRRHPGGCECTGHGTRARDQAEPGVLEDEQRERHGCRASEVQPAEPVARTTGHDERADEGQAQRQRDVGEHLHIAEDATAGGRFPQDGGKEQGRADRRDRPRGPCPCQAGHAVHAVLAAPAGTDPAAPLRVPSSAAAGPRIARTALVTSVHSRPSRNGTGT
jgi:hypothetical protein